MATRLARNDGFCQPELDTAHDPGKFPHMDMDELFAKQPGDPLTLLAKQDLDPFSVDELHDRVAVLERELTRVKVKIAGAVDHRASADSLFKC